jgi:HlyD family secretion protein
VAAAVLLIGGGITAGWTLLGRPAALVVKATTVRERGGAERSTVLNASGYVTARRRATVSAKITGRLTDVLVEEGMPVDAGQVLARLDDTLFTARLRLVESQLEAARRGEEEIAARLDLATLTLKRTERLVRDGVSGQADLDAAATEVDALEARLALERQRILVAEREVELRRTELDDTVVRSPFEGIVISKDAQAGEMVSPMSAGGSFTRTGICTIVDMGSLEIEIDVNEAYISRVEPDQRVEATLDAYPGWQIPGRVITTVPAADRQRATVLVRIAFEELDPRILPDMGVKVAFQDREAAAPGDPISRIYLPHTAVGSDGGREVVFVVAGNRVERRAVSLGRENQDEVEVLSGVSAGERVVTEIPAGMADGDAVDIE